MSLSVKELCANCSEGCHFKKLLTEDDKNLYLNKILHLSYHKKETVIKQNSHCSHAIYLKKGLVKVFTERRNEKNIILKIVPSMNFIGLNTLYSDVYNFSAVALKETEACLMPREYFFNIIQNNFEFASHVFREQSKISAFLVDKISSLGTKQMHGRLADTIVYLANKDLLAENIFEHISRRDIAELSGMSPESAIRLLAEFKNDGLIKLNGKSIEINNYELLNRLSEIG
jgi:CRP/FNR family transcriptional regulator, polysaccharide utilization system transcription regulator